MSCSPMIARSGDFEPLLERDDRERQRARARGLRLMIGRDELERLEAVLGEHMAQALARAVAPAGDDHVQPASAQRLDMRDRGVEHVGVLVLPLGREIAPDPAAAVERRRAAPGGASKGVSRASGGAASRSFHSSSVR